LITSKAGGLPARPSEIHCASIGVVRPERGPLSGPGSGQPNWPDNAIVLRAIVLWPEWQLPISLTALNLSIVIGCLSRPATGHARQTAVVSARALLGLWKPRVFFPHALAWGWLDHVHELTLERVDTGFVLFFLVELVLRIKRAGWRWLRQPMNFVDAGIIILALCPVIGDGITIARMARAAKLLHLSRHISHLRIATWVGRWINRPPKPAWALAAIGAVLLTASAPAHADEPHCPETAAGCPTQHAPGFDCRYDGPRICLPVNPQGDPPGWYGNDDCWPGAIYCPPPDSPPDDTVIDP
jgi:hypothetical protein